MYRDRVVRIPASAIPSINISTVIMFKISEGVLRERISVVFLRELDLQVPKTTQVQKIRRTLQASIIKIFSLSFNISNLAISKT